MFASYYDKNAFQVSLISLVCLFGFFNLPFLDEKIKITLVESVQCDAD